MKKYVGNLLVLCVGAELANVANEGALECGRRGGRLISKADIYNGIDRILQVPFPPLNLQQSLLVSTSSVG